MLVVDDDEGMRTSVGFLLASVGVACKTFASSWRDAVQARLAQFSRREREVLTLVLDGKQNKEIAAVLNISLKTVEGHRQMAMEKMRARSVAELARIMLAPEDEAPI